jgi:E3 ubiquitin-protein ligase RAD18
MRDSALRKKLSELGIPNDGSRALMEKRHIEWVNLVNANCDSRHPRPRRELLNRLQLWENSQRNAAVLRPKTGEDVMQKDFDHQSWSSKHNSDFHQLIASARAKSKATAISNREDIATQESPSSNDKSVLEINSVREMDQVIVPQSIDRPPLEW